MEEKITVTLADNGILIEQEDENETHVVVALDRDADRTLGEIIRGGIRYVMDKNLCPKVQMQIKYETV